MSGLEPNFFSRNDSVPVGRPVVHPRQQAEREHVLGALLVLAGQGVERGEGLDGDRGQGDGVDVPGLEAAVVERVGGVADLGEVALGELVGVGDDRRAAGQVAQVGLEGGRVHRDEHVGGVAGGEHVVVGEVQLEAGDAGQGALGRADLGREVGQGRQVVAQRRGLGGEAVSRELHAVARVTCEPDHDSIEALDGLAARLCLRHCVFPPPVHLLFVARRAPPADVLPWYDCRRRSMRATRISDTRACRYCRACASTCRP